MLNAVKKKSINTNIIKKKFRPCHSSEYIDTLDTTENVFHAIPLTPQTEVSGG